MSQLRESERIFNALSESEREAVRRWFIPAPDRPPPPQTPKSGTGNQADRAPQDR